MPDAHSYAAPRAATRPRAALAAAALAVTLVGTIGTAVPGPAAGPERTARQRVLVTSLGGDAAAAAAAVRAAGGRVLRTLSLVAGVSAELPRGAVLAPGLRVVPNTPLRVAGAQDEGQGGTDGDQNGKDGKNGTDGKKGTGGTDAAGDPVSTVRATVGLGAPRPADGAGVTVAVVDTGVADVPGLAGRVTHVDVSGEGAGDGYGHGTFVAGLVAGSGAPDGSYAGVAPGARVLDVRVADDRGRTDLLTVLTGLEAVDPARVQVLNLSLSSGSTLPYQIDPLSQALEALWRRGVTVVVPAGNDGPADGTVTAPGTDPVLLTAGGQDERGTPDRADDVVAEFSGRGPAPQGVAKPDLVAPASHLVSLRAPGSAIDRANPRSRVGADYFRGSGTSFATAVTSGVAAVLLAERGALRPAQVKALLTGTAARPSGLRAPTAAGAGGVDAAAALAAPAPAVGDEAAAAAPGDPQVWTALVEALLSGDARAAASSWSRLSPEARNWAASSWSALSPALRAWAASSWSGRNWAGASAEEWAARNWAARNWAARNWAASSWSARNWAGRNWSTADWAGRNWSGADWSTADWAGRNWSARNWSGSWS